MARKVNVVNKPKSSVYVFLTSFHFHRKKKEKHQNSMKDGFYNEMENVAGFNIKMTLGKY